MPLLDRPEFWRWLEDAESAHSKHTNEKPAAKRQDCGRCGGTLSADFDSSCGECLVCLAERFGREQAEEAAYIGRALMLALMAVPDTPPDVARASIDDVMDDYELFAAARAEATVARR